jgi:hypothetical protein
MAGNVYMVAGAGGNIALSSSGDGVIISDTAPRRGRQVLPQSARLWLQTTGRPGGPSPLRHSRTRLATHFPDPVIRLIIDTNDNSTMWAAMNIRSSPISPHPE